jgi:uncharacterized SAM-binding protein YcdF (DUF218 family)
MPRLRAGLCIACVLFTGLFLLLQLTPLMSWYAGKLAGNWTDADGDILIVLANDVEPGDILGLSSYWRTVYAIRAWREGHFRTLVVSGGQPPGGSEPMAAVIGRFLEANGVPRDKIVLESAAQSTRQNALFTARLIGRQPGRKVLLTSDYHMYRASRAFAAAGLPVTPRPFPDVIKQANTWFNREYCAGVLAGETAKIAAYQLRGWLTPEP